MYLKRLEIHGFKSFAHKTVLEFEPGITSVVGPNGSGKSNVADALRWVMGEQSLKILRGKKSEDVIFAGSDKKSKLGMAEVSLTFDNRDRKLPFDFGEVEITRRIYRNGESEYQVNRQKVRLMDVVEALNRSGFGGSNYTVIGQGMIDQMILAGPAEVKVLVEEASGVKPYYVKREKTIRRLEQTEENLKQASQLINEIEPRLRSLKRQAKRMEEREVVANELKGLNQQYFGNQFYLLETELNALKQALDLKHKAMVGLESEVLRFEQALEKHEQESRQSGKFGFELSKKIDTFEQRRLKIQEDLAELRGKIKSSFVPGQIDKESLALEKANLTSELEQAEMRLKDIDTKLAADDKAFNKLKETLTKLESQIKQAQSVKFDAKAWQKELNEFKNEFIKNLEQLNAENLNEIKEQLRAVVQKLTDSRTSRAATEEDLVQLQKEKELIVLDLHQIELRIVEQKTMRAAFNESVSDLGLKLNRIKSMLKEDHKQFVGELESQERQLSAQFASIIKEVNEARASLMDHESKEKSKKSFLLEEEKKYRRQSSELSILKDEQSRVMMDKVRIETRLEALNKEISEAGIVLESLARHKKADLDPELINRIEKLKHQLELSGGVDETILNEYRETDQRYQYLTQQSDDLSKASKDLTQVVEELDQVIKKQFDEAYEKISTKFSEYFRILFNGGRAHMNLLKEIVEEESLSEDEGEAVSEEQEDAKPHGTKQIVGIEIKATPPGKKLSSIAALSGGERALTSIALLCAMLASYPSPFVVLDEVDAALDEANSVRFASILGTLAHQTQFVTITHNRETMRQAHTLYGVTMNDEGISKILSIKLEQAEKVVPMS
jgi:chromosome segregation protein